MTPTEIRAKELFRMVYPDNTDEIWFLLYNRRKNWLKLARYVLSLETKLAKAKKRKCK